MKIKHIEEGHKIQFDNIEDVMQTFFSIARALYDVGVADEEEEDTSKGIVTATATIPEKGTIRIRIDYPEGVDFE